MKINKEEAFKLYKYYKNKAMPSRGTEKGYVEREIFERYLNDIEILKAVRDFCPLEFIEYYYNKYFRWLYSARCIIFNNQENFTKGFRMLDIPKDMFSEEEADILINALRKSAIDFGLIVRQMKTYDLPPENTKEDPEILGNPRYETYRIFIEWGKEYITDEKYMQSKKDLNKFDEKFYKKEDPYSLEKKKIKIEIKEKIISMIREQIERGEIVFTNNRKSLGDSNYKVFEFIDACLGKNELYDSLIASYPRMKIFAAEIYYRFRIT